MKRALSLMVSALAVLSPASAWADDGGLDDAGLDLRDAAPACTDGLNVGDIAACDAKKAGEACVLPDGVPGSCAELRCIGASGQRVLSCVAAAGAPPPVVTGDASMTPAYAPGAAGGGACAMGVAGRRDALPVAAFLGCVALVAAMRRRRARN
ncbi:MAG: hypothetical protein HOO96_44545 [Polyangiaceae bacterium]|nr:hypothetical protein [Polyangiaceae bacterium]